MKWSEFVVLDEGEHILKTIECRHSISVKKVLTKGLSTESETITSGGAGYVLMTENRVLFIKKHGIFNVSHRPEFEIRYDNIIGIMMDKNSLFITERWRGEHSFKAKGIQTLFSELHSLVKKRTQRVREDKKRAMIKVSFDFDELRALLEKKSISAESIDCPFCGAQVEFPKEGQVSVCEYCRRDIHVIDVFQKIRDLLFGE